LLKTLSHSENGWDLTKEFSEFKGVFR